eukprot:TRINITY_DN25828_c0_g1_i1.p2 TRINITY_DN25828_c0_g1~~TRINITY_DN25828_c0_g1_i1.p2  ORF type:complete len:125 (+),score=37.27 TRINITY_DN25828_c0_g1_i1:95-469(+)
MAMPNLVVNFYFNPPTIRIMGPIKEATIEKLNEVFPRLTSTVHAHRRGPPVFEKMASPPHWAITLKGHFCDQLGQSMLFLGLLDALEEEGGWILKDCNAVTMEDIDAVQQAHYEVCKFFFVKKI